MEKGKSLFGTLPDGTPVHIFTLDNGQGMTASVLDYGGVVVSLSVPDRSGRPDDVVLGYDDIDGYLADRCYFGALIGRFGNRIGRSRFVLDGRTVTLPANEGKNHLHGGPRGFNRAMWEAGEYSPHTAASVGAEASLELGYVSADGEEGYPGNLFVTTRYSLTSDNALVIDYEAVADAPTVVNLTQHSYFNLAGAGNGDICGHELTLFASAYTPVDAELLPTGEIAPVAGTPLDFTKPAAIGARVDADFGQLRPGGGYDHNFVLDKPKGASGRPTLAARVVEPGSGRVMEMETTEPGAQFYSGNFIPDGLPGKGGRAYVKRGGFCLEAQHFPDSPNRPEFPSVVLQPGARYRQTTLYRFSAV